MESLREKVVKIISSELFVQEIFDIFKLHDVKTFYTNSPALQSGLKHYFLNCYYATADVVVAYFASGINVDYVSISISTGKLINFSYKNGPTTRPHCLSGRREETTNPENVFYHSLPLT